MKLALIGGGGVRAPEFVRGALAFAEQLDLQELWLMDTDGGRLSVVTQLCETMARDSRVRILHTTDLDIALRGATAIVTTIRVGGEQGRILDERIALQHGVLGQETTGAGGFAMALRSIPAILHIAERAAEIAPDAWLFNFTNPAGLVAQALHDAGYARSVGICDSANGAQHDIADWLGVPSSAVVTEVYGLNHLSWARSAYHNGIDVLPRALADDTFLAHTHLKLFDSEFVRRKATYLNEYLYYWYYRNVALARILAEPQTRGEEIAVLNRGLFIQLSGLTPTEALAAFDAYHARRSSTYMGNVGGTENPSPPIVSGYAGVALQTLAALRGSDKFRIALNVPNGMALAALDATDVVEVSCTVANGGITPHIIHDSLPEDDALLMQAVKRYERLTVEAVNRLDRALAIDALLAHPLVGSYPVARTLVNEYLEAHQEWVGKWS
ncbi:MAG: 6-phospho-beta-glucosidase [Chloroflexota bacterium]|nr:6-phospho-beta-glucosidase [Chloroflexota bacterium]